MDSDKLKQWANLLLDTGKRNNLVNFKDTKVSTLEILQPDIETLFGKVESQASFEVFDPGTAEIDDYDYAEGDGYENVEAGSDTGYEEALSQTDVEKAIDLSEDDSYTFDAPEGGPNFEGSEDQSFSEKSSKVGKYNADVSLSSAADDDKDDFPIDKERAIDLTTNDSETYESPESGPLYDSSESGSDGAGAEGMNSSESIFGKSAKTGEKSTHRRLTRQEYLETYSPKIRRANQILLYNEWTSPLDAVKNIHKKAKSIIDETGVNVAYIAFGFIHWSEGNSSKVEYKAPVLLSPVTFSNDSAISPYYIKMTEDDVIVNPTFSFKMDGEQGLKLPEYEDQGLDGYLDLVQEIAGKLGWTVSRECKIGLFSFLKINMYQDLMKNADEILNNNIIRTLLGEEIVPENEMAGSPDLYGEEADDAGKDSLAQLHNIVDADSSQIEAIRMAKSGRSFVLQGPPGTGKSQTITNIIAECLSDGKKILFVSEKQAALNVVYDKLKKAGLDEFCLELHSYKANKKDVIDDLCHTLRMPKSTVSRKADDEILQKIKAQNSLDEYERELHMVREPLHMSLYQLYEAYSKYKEAPDSEIVIKNIDTKGSEHIANAAKMLDQYAKYVQFTGYDYRKCTWYGFCDTDSGAASYENMQKLKDNMQTLAQNLEDLMPEARKISDLFGFRPENLQDVKDCYRLLTFLGASRYISPEFLNKGNFIYLTGMLDLLRGKSRSLLALREKIDKDYSTQIYDIDADAWNKALKTEYSGFLKRLFSRDYKEMINTLALASRSGKPSYDEALEITQKIAEYQTMLQAFSEEEYALKPGMGPSYRGVDTDWDQLDAEMDQLRAFYDEGLKTRPAYESGYANAGSDAVSGMLNCESGNESGYSNAGSGKPYGESGNGSGNVNYGSVAGSGNVNYGSGLASGSDEAVFGNLAGYDRDTFERRKAEFLSAAKALEGPLSACTGAAGYLKKSFDAVIVDFDHMPMNDLVRKMDACLNDMPGAASFSRQWLLIRNMEKEGVREFLDKAIDLQIPVDAFARSYSKSFYYQWIGNIINQTPALFLFNRLEQDNNVKIFCQKDQLQFEISKAQIKASLCAKKPSLGLITSGSAVAALLREGEKKRRQKSIRQLFSEVGDLVQIIKPCFLMSPLSVSTFLDSQRIRFDVVIFDEASQVFPQDAAGAIYRGAQLIVVGDSKQMPPSNFFNSVTEAEPDKEEESDVTDFESILDICSASMQQIRLKWHYRSTCEELIAFSNKNFYDNELITFPSALGDREGIGVDFYYAGGTYDRRSRNNLVEARFVVDLILKNADLYPDRSLGVVAFSISQQNLIEKLLDQKRLEDPSREEFFAADKAEPFFIKNLETVQGDERDTIIFSVGYAKDSQGRFLHNFGPLNQAGGERRLNVAVTRARTNVQLVASIHHTDIDLSRTSAVGARLLREYIDYAENGNIALERAVSVNPFDRFDSGFEMEVCDFLRENGYSVDTQVGCSNFRIDIGLKMPDSSDYLLAIECDGASYHSSKNARDRDRLRQQILERMGWKFYRIWSTDWFRNNAVEKKLLLEAAGAAVDEAVKKKEEAKNKAAAAEKKNDGNLLFEEVQPEEKFEFPRYEMANIHYICSVNNNFISIMKQILEKEAPLCEEWLLGRICFYFNRTKVTNVVREQYQMAVYDCQRYGITRRDGFLYLDNISDLALRLPPENGEKRDIKYIAPEELACGMYELIGQNINVEKDSLFRSLAKMLGSSRMGDSIREQFENALQLLLAQGKVRIEEGTDILSLNL